MVEVDQALKLIPDRRRHGGCGLRGKMMRLVTAWLIAERDGKSIPNVDDRDPDHEFHQFLVAELSIMVARRLLHDRYSKAFRARR